MAGLEKGGKGECEYVRNCSLRPVKSDCDTQERQAPCAREIVRLSRTQDSGQILLLTALKAFQPVP